MNGNNMASPASKALIAQRYEIRNALGSGGTGAVFQAWDTQLHRFVAVKRLNSPAPLPETSEGTERLWREAMTLAAIQHPNILTIHDFGVDDFAFMGIVFLFLVVFGKQPFPALVGGRRNG